MFTRKVLRLNDFDYSGAGFYFVTICSAHMAELFGMVINETVVLNNPGRIVEDSWLKVGSLHENIRLDEYMIMPNHVHGIIIIEDNVADANFASTTQRTEMLLSKVIQQFKRAVTIQINKERSGKGAIWQRSYFDRVIRNEKELYQIRNYIRQNPLKWHLEKNEIVNLSL